MSRERAVQLLLDRAALHDLLLEYASGVDRRDMAAVAACFTPDVRARYGPKSFDNRDELVEFIRGVRFFHTTMHCLGNQFIEVDGDEARLETLGMLTHHTTRPDGEPFEYNNSDARYVDRLRRVDGRWRIEERGGDPVWAPRGVTEVKSDDGAVQWLLDRAEIHDCLTQYALGVDLRDYDRIGACFAPEFRAVYFDREFNERKPLLDFIRGVELFPSTTHFLAKPLVDLDGDQARVHSVALITSRDEERKRERTTGAHYIDRFERIRGRWKIRERAHPGLEPAAPFRGAPQSPDPEVQRLIDRAAVRECVARSALESSDAETTHFVGNQRVELSGDRARVESYVYVTAREKPWSHGAVRYVDRLGRDGEGWRIEERQVSDNRISDWRVE